MIRCLVDNVPEDSKCARCCIYCNEECECRCGLASECISEESVFEADCPNAFDI